MKKVSFIMSCVILGIAAGNFVLSLLALLQKDR